MINMFGIQHTYVFKVKHSSASQQLYGRYIMVPMETVCWDALKMFESVSGGSGTQKLLVAFHSQYINTRFIMHHICDFHMIYWLNIHLMLLKE